MYMTARLMQLLLSWCRAKPSEVPLPADFAPLPLSPPEQTKRSQQEHPQRDTADSSRTQGKAGRNCNCSKAATAEGGKARFAR